MSAIRKSYDMEFKLEAIRLAESSGKPTPQVERELGLPKLDFIQIRIVTVNNTAHRYSGSVASEPVFVCSSFQETLGNMGAAIAAVVLELMHPRKLASVSHTRLLGGPETSHPG
jgi:hypothetical protein